MYTSRIIMYMCVKSDELQNFYTCDVCGIDAQGVSLNWGGIHLLSLSACSFIGMPPIQSIERTPG